MRCEVCDGPLNIKGAKHGACVLCRHAGARFARRWMLDLCDAGHSYREIAAIVGSTYNTVGVRVRELRRANAVG